MRGLERNKRPIWYATYLGKTEIIDANGNRTGEFTESYSEPVKVLMNVAPATGRLNWMQFGAYLSYDIAAMTFEMDLPISETSKIWVYKEPTERNDYVVVRVGRSINNVVYALKGVGTSDKG